MRSLAFLFFISLADFANGSSITAVANGSWQSATTWNCHCVPSPSDSVIIPSGVSVTSTESVALAAGPAIQISVYGTLILIRSNLYLDANDLVEIFPLGKISGGGSNGGIVYSGTIPFFVNAGASVVGPARITSGILPQQLRYFTGKVMDHEIMLQWASMPGKDFDTYRLLRSSDGVHFKEITQVCGIAGDASKDTDCFYYDIHPLAEVSYYKLKAVSLGGDDSEVIIIVADNKIRRRTF